MRIISVIALAAGSAFAAEPVTMESSHASEDEWSELYRASFSGGDNLSEPTAGAEEAASDELLLNVASLPVRVVFGAPSKRWVGDLAPENFVEDRRSGTIVEIDGCRLKLQTGPLQIATYEMSRGKLTVTSDSLPPRAQLTLPENSDAYVAASAELTVQVIGKTDLCAKRLAGRLVPVGRFSFDATQINVAGPEDDAGSDVASATTGGIQDVYLMWPAGVDTPVLLDAMGPHPQVESGIRRIHGQSADLYLDVKPKLERVADLGSDPQRAASLQALYGRQSR